MWSRDRGDKTYVALGKDNENFNGDAHLCSVAVVVLPIALEGGHGLRVLQSPRIGGKLAQDATEMSQMPQMAATYGLYGFPSPKGKCVAGITWCQAVNAPPDPGSPM